MHGLATSRRGLTPQERAIMDRWDGGQSIRRIARDLGKEVQKVRNTVICYDGAADHRLHVRTMAASSARLLDALAREQR